MLADFVDYGADAAVFRPEIVAPLRNAVGFVDGIERDGNCLEKFNVFLFRQRFGRHIEQFGLARQDVGFHLIDGAAVERRIQKVSDSVVGREVAHCVDLVFHQGDERRNHDRCALHEQGGQLIAERFSAAGGHEHEHVVSSHQRKDNLFLVSFESIETKVFFKCLGEQLPLVHGDWIVRG